LNDNALAVIFKLNKIQVALEL